MKQIVVNLSNHHLHISREDLDILFGKDYELTVKADLMQPGQFAAHECVELIGPKGSLPKLRILGPVRNNTQIELLASDVYKLGIEPPPARDSGDVKGSSPFTIRGPKGEVSRPEGLIIAKRHIHLDPGTAVELGLNDRQVVALRGGDPGRKIVFEDVLVRVKESYAAECHLDFNEGNACGLENGTLMEILD